MDPIVDYQEYVALIVSPPTQLPITHRWSGMVWSAKCRIKDTITIFKDTVCSSNWNVFMCETH